METVDARGLSCPEPVVLTRNALKSSPASLTVLVDASAAHENVTRFAKSQGYSVDESESNGEWTLSLSK